MKPFNYRLIIVIIIIKKYIYIIKYNFYYNNNMKIVSHLVLGIIKYLLCIKILSLFIIWENKNFQQKNTRLYS